MKKSVIFLTLLLIASIAGTFAVYKLYVEQRMRELGEHMDEERQLIAKISELEETFFRTKPEAVLTVLRESTQPWADGVDRRGEFFNLGAIPLEVDIPEESIPKFYYQKVYPEKIEELENYAWEKSRTVLVDPTFGIPNPDTYKGLNPKPKEIEAHLVHFEFGSAVTKLLIDAGAESVDTFVIWPEGQIMQGRSGNVKGRRTGVVMWMTLPNLVRFLDKLAQDNRYFAVDAIRISNKTLRTDASEAVFVEMLLSQGYYEESKSAAAGGTVEERQASLNTFAGLFGGGSTAAASGGGGRKRKSDSKSAWQKFRQRFLPF